MHGDVGSKATEIYPLEICVDFPGKEPLCKKIHETWAQTQFPATQEQRNIISPNQWTLQYLRPMVF